MDGDAHEDDNKSGPASAFTHIPRRRVSEMVKSAGEPESSDGICDKKQMSEEGMMNLENTR